MCKCQQLESLKMNHSIFRFIPYDPELDKAINIRKTNQIIAAVVQNQVDVLQTLLDFPEWYYTRDNKDYTLLQLAIDTQKIGVFDYLLSLPNFPLELENLKGETAFDFCMKPDVDFPILRNNRTEEYFICELINKGVCINKTYFGGNTALHCVIKRCNFRAAKLLIKRGVDVNVCNDSEEYPLELIFDQKIFKSGCFKADFTDIVMTLLGAGAMPSVKIFEAVVIQDLSVDLQNIVFLYVFDDLTEVKISFGVLIKLALNNKHLFYDVLKKRIKVTIGEIQKYDLFVSLCCMNIEELKFLYEKFGPFVKKTILQQRGQIVIFVTETSLENLLFMLESPLQHYVINFLNRYCDSRTFLRNLVNPKYDESTVTKFVCFLLNYCNLKLTAFDLQTIYHAFGYSELIKTILRMELDMTSDELHALHIDFFVILISDVTATLETYLTDPSKYSPESSYVLMDYFVHPNLRKIHYKYVRQGVVKMRENGQNIPLLQELARNKFRKYFIKKFRLKTARDFYIRLNQLHIGYVLKEIISYERKLY